MHLVIGKSSILDNISHSVRDQNSIKELSHVIQCSEGFGVKIGMIALYQTGKIGDVGCALLMSLRLYLARGQIQMASISLSRGLELPR